MRRPGPAHDRGVSRNRPPAEEAGYASGGALQRLRLREGGELANRVLLDLPRALAGQVEDLAHLVERPWRLPVQAVAELDDSALTVGEVLERLLERVLGHVVHGRVER